MTPGPGVSLGNPSANERLVARNTVLLVAADAAAKGLTFLFFVVAARRLGADGFGVFSYALAYAGFFAVLADLGFGVVVARDIAGGSSHAVSSANTAVSLRGIAGLLAVVLVALSVNLVNPRHYAVNVTILASLYIIPYGVALLYWNIYQGTERMAYSAATRLVQAAVMTSGALLLALVPVAIRSFIWLYVLSWGLCAGLSVVLGASVGFPLRLSLDVGLARSLLKRSLPAGIAVVLTTAYYWNGTAMLAFFHSDAAVGLFNAPFRLVLGASFVAYGFTQAVYPSLVRLHTSDPAALGRVLTTCVNYVMLVGVPLGIIGSILGQNIVQVLYGKQYVLSGGIMSILAWWGLFAYLNSILSSYSFAVNKPWVVMVQTGLALVLSVCLNLLLIPRHGAAGAAYSIVVAECASCLFLMLMQVAAKVHLNFGEVGLKLLRLGALSIVAGLIGKYVCSFGMLLGTAAAVVLYLLLILLTGELGSRERNVLLALVGRQSG